MILSKYKKSFTVKTSKPHAKNRKTFIVRQTGNILTGDRYYNLYKTSNELDGYDLFRAFVDGDVSKKSRQILVWKG